MGFKMTITIKRKDYDHKCHNCSYRGPVEVCTIRPGRRWVSEFPCSNKDVNPLGRLRKRSVVGGTCKGWKRYEVEVTPEIDFSGDED